MGRVIPALLPEAARLPQHARAPGGDASEMVHRQREAAKRSPGGGESESPRTVVREAPTAMPAS